MMAMTAGALSLGNLDFSGDGKEGSTVAGPAVAEVARLWGVKEEALRKAVTVRTIEVRGTTTEIPLKQTEAPETGAAFAMSAYRMLFDWLVSRINAVLEGARGGGGKCIGILDIFGFEIFEINSFEQLCINYCNEKLQQLFNETTFKQEEALYRAEGVDYDHVPFIDNQPVLHLIESKPTGIFALLDDEVVVPKGCDEGFVRNVHKQYKDAKLIRVFAPQGGKQGAGFVAGFAIQHYAGEVSYKAEGFVEKDRDQISPDLSALMHSSSAAVCQAVFPKPKPGTRRSPLSRTTLSSQFKGQLTKLMETLRQTQPHFIRCIKPNSAKKKRDFDGPMARRAEPQPDPHPNANPDPRRPRQPRSRPLPAQVLEQLRYSGVFEAVTIRKSGYPFRLKLDSFVAWCARPSPCPCPYPCPDP